MTTIFDREFRKEKTLDVSRRLGGPKTKEEEKEQKDPNELEATIA
jgi:hypothetical protein